MPPITGKAGEVIVVIDNETFKGAIGDSLWGILSQEELALHQTGMEGAEPMFDVIQVPPDAFSNIFRSHRNIIFVEIDTTLTQPVIKIERDYWARGQLLMRLGAPSKEAFATLLYEKDDFIVETIRDAEIDRQIGLNRKMENPELVNQLKRNHNLIVQFPKGYTARVDTGNFVWIQHDPEELMMGVFIYHYPYQDESQIAYENLLQTTDQWLKPRVIGGPKNSYMAIEMEAPLYSKAFEFNGNYVREIKGLWEMENDFMGGPFVSWSFVDVKNNRIVTLFGFVYAPKYKKRNHIRKIESLLRTVSFSD